MRVRSLKKTYLRRTICEKEKDGGYSIRRQ